MPNDPDDLGLHLNPNGAAYLGLHNMLGAANDHQLAPRLFSSSTKELDAWLRLVSRQGDVLGVDVADGP